MTEIQDPLLLKTMRDKPERHVQVVDPSGEFGKQGTTCRGFVWEYDAALEQAEMRGYEKGLMDPGSAWMQSKLNLTEVEVNRLAQAFYDAAALTLPSMTDKPKIVAGLKAVFEQIGIVITEEELDDRLTEKEKALRDRLRDDFMGGAETWMLIKGGFRRSYQAGMRAVINAAPRRSAVIDG